jgi:hypothetical protein
MKAAMTSTGFALLFAALLLCVGDVHAAFQIGRDDAESGLPIVIPPDATEQVQFAANQLQKYLGQIFGVPFPVQKGNPPATGKRILIQGENPGPKATLGKDGYAIEIQAEQVVITGGLPRGVMYGVVSFLEENLGCRYFTPDCRLIPKREQILLEESVRRYVPPLPYRDTNSLFAQDPDWATWHKLNGSASAADAPRGKVERFHVNWHSLKTYLPTEKYFDKHPEYYAQIDGHRVKDGQICLTNPEVRGLVADAVLEKIKDYDLLSVSQDEGGNDCQCSACLAIIQREGSHSGPLIDFINAIADRVAEKYPDKRILTLAYQWSTDAPAHLKARPNVLIQICSIGAAFNHPLTHPLNKEFDKQLKGWTGHCDNLSIWDYTINFWHLLAPFPNLYVIAPNIRYFVENHLAGVFEQSQSFHPAGELVELRSYLIAKALWNPNIDTDQVIDEFVNGYYGAAAPMIRQYITTIHKLAADDAFFMGIYSGCTCASEACKNNHNLPPTWSPEQTHQLVALFDKAEAAVAADPELLKRVRRARLPLMFKQISGEYLNLGTGQQPDPQLSHKELGELVDRFVALARQEGATRFCEFDDDDTGTLDVWLAGFKKWYDAQAK